MSDTPLKPRLAVYETPEPCRGRRLYAEFQHRNPARPLDWRWDRASHLVEENRPLSARYDDPETLRAARYLKALNRCQTDRQRAAVAHRYPDIATAHQLHSDGGASRWITEARFLARQTVDEIAGCASVPVSAIVAYESLFFNVAGALDATGFILARTMRKVVRWEVWEEDVDVILKLLAYSGGPVVLDAVIPFVLTPDMDLTVLPDDQRLLGERVRRFVTVLTMPINNNTVGKLFALYVAMLKAQVSAQMQNGSEGLTAGAILDEAFARFDADQSWPDVCEVA